MASMRSPKSILCGFFGSNLRYFAAGVLGFPVLVKAIRTSGILSESSLSWAVIDPPRDLPPLMA